MNPLLTRQFTRATICKKKTDADDCLVIAKFIAQGEGRTVGVRDVDLTAKSEQRPFRKLRQEQQKFILMRQNLAMHESSDSAAVLAAILDKVESAVRCASEEHLAYLKRTYAHDPVITLLQSIPSIGFQTALAIRTEVGDVSRFPSEKQLLAFTGLDPRVKQSGSVLNSRGRITKRGSPTLRHALFLATQSARRSDPELKRYYEGKRAEGKKYTVAICATTRKLVSRIYAVWKRGTPYVKNVLCSVGGEMGLA